MLTRWLRAGWATGGPCGEFFSIAAWEPARLEIVAHARSVGLALGLFHVKHGFSKLPRASSGIKSFEAACGILHAGSFAELH